MTDTTTALAGAQTGPRATQLVLPFRHLPGYAPADLIRAQGNRAALAWLDRPVWPAGRLMLWGDAGCGKTHLLHLWAARRQAAIRPGASLSGLPAPPDRPTAIDDADLAHDESLLHLLNAAAEGGHAVLMANRLPPGRWLAGLPDLVSRLRATPAVRIDRPDDALLHGLLLRLLADRQMLVPDAVVDWLLARLPRCPAALREAAAELDRLAWASDGRVTRAMAGAVLARLDGAVADTDTSDVENACKLPGLG